MTGRRRLGLVAAAATLLAAAPLSAIFDTWTWLLQCTLAVGLTAGAAVLTRTLRFPLWAQALGMIVVLLLVLTWAFPSGEELAGLIPSPGTFDHFGSLFTEAGVDTRTYGVPVPDRSGLLFITVLGVGGCAIVVDMLTVALRKPALAGLPMLAIYSVPVAVYPESVPVLPFVIGAVGFLWLLVADNVDRVRRFGRRFTGDGRDVDVWEPSPLAAAGRRLALVGVVAAVLLPLAVPAMSGGLLSQLTDSGGGNGTGPGTGTNGRLDLFASLQGQLTQNEVVDVLKVTTNEPDPFYLRLAIADELTEKGFRYRSPSGQPLAGALVDPRDQNVSTEFGQFRAKVEILNLNMALAPAFATVIRADDLGRNWSYDQNGQTIFSRTATIRNSTYSFDYVRARFKPAQLRTAPAIAADSATSPYTRAPADPVVDAKVKQLIRNKKTEYDKVRAIYDSFSAKEGFRYSLTTTGGTSGSEIANFLTSKTGYCQQYAAAMAWMVRAAGIPARVVFGYTRGGTPEGDIYTITNRNAHAWTEVYFQGYGWVPFDATPAASVVGSARTNWAPDPDAPDPVESSTAGPAAPGATSSAGPGAADRPDRDLNDPDLGVGTSSTSGGISTTALLITGAIALAIALLLIPSLLRRVVRRRRHAATAAAPVAAPATVTGPGSPLRDVTVTTESARARQDAHAAWDELIDTMVDYRVPVDPTETPRHTAQRLVRVAELTDDPATSAQLLGTAEERARYARTPLQGGELTDALEAVRKGLAGTSDRRTRLMAVLLPPSVLLRWRLGAADSSVRWLGAFGRIRVFLSRFSPRRLLPSRSN